MTDLDIPEWIGRVRAIPRSGFVRILIVQVGKEWLQRDAQRLILDLEQEIARVVLGHEGDIEVFRLLGVEGKEREEWIRLFASWSHFQQDRILVRPLYSPDPHIRSVLKVYTREDAQRYDREVRELEDAIRTRVLNLRKRASGTSHRDRYPVTGSL